MKFLFFSSIALLLVSVPFHFSILRDNNNFDVYVFDLPVKTISFKKTCKIDCASVYNKNVSEKVEQIASDNSKHNLSHIFEVFNELKYKAESNYPVLISIFLFIITLEGLVFVYSAIDKKIKLMAEENLILKKKVKDLQLSFSRLKKSIEKPGGDHIDNSEQTIQSKVIQQAVESIAQENKLSENELNCLISDNNRWVVLAHSATGKMHLKKVPPIPCQDSHFTEDLYNGWYISIVSDGAGSAKYSHLGSDFIARKAIPGEIKVLLNESDWYKSDNLPSEKEWRSLVLKAFERSFQDLQEWIVENGEEGSTVRDYACTVILTLHNKNGILVANIGDGRGGYMNLKGEFRSLFTPYKGQESNATVFITSPVWENNKEFIQSSVINDTPLSIFLLSDGMEKISFNCSKMAEGIWFDPNIPFKNFFFPILKTIKSIPEEDEGQLHKMWGNLLEEGNETIKNENDDKTMIIYFLK